VAKLLRKPEESGPRSSLLNSLALYLLKISNYKYLHNLAKPITSINIASVNLITMLKFPIPFSFVKNKADVKLQQPPVLFLGE
jgi:hypothetical protein